MTPVALTMGNTPPPAASQLEVVIDNVRDSRGLLQLCLTRDPRHFPDCATDPAAIKASIGAAARTIRLTAAAPGRYALSVLHDANANGRADTVLGVPREGFGFSRNPVIRFGPPRFAETAIDLVPGLNRQTVRMRYLL